MSTTEPAIRRVIIEGGVQGVGYREFARRSAAKHGVCGWVRNRSDGTVEALLQGPAEKLDAMLADLRVGPRGAQVRRLSLNDPEPGDGDLNESRFEVRATK